MGQPSYYRTTWYEKGGVRTYETKKLTPHHEFIRRVKHGKTVPISLQTVAGIRMAFHGDPIGTDPGFDEAEKAYYAERARAKQENLEDQRRDRAARAADVLSARLAKGGDELEILATALLEYRQTGRLA